MKKTYLNLLERVVFFAISFFCMFIIAKGLSISNKYFMLAGLVGFVWAIFINNSQIRYDALEEGFALGKESYLKVSEVFDEVIDNCEKICENWSDEEKVDYVTKELCKKLNVTADDLEVSLIAKPENEKQKDDSNANQ